MRRGISERAVRHQLAVFVSLSLRSTTSSVKSSGQIRCEQLATSVLKCGITLGSGFINPHTFCPIFSQTACSASEFNTTASSTFDILSGDTSFNLNIPQLKKLYSNDTLEPWSYYLCMPPPELLLLTIRLFLRNRDNIHSKFQMRRRWLTFLCLLCVDNRDSQLTRR